MRWKTTERELIIDKYQLTANTTKTDARKIY